jgi:hypothetical protein
MSWSSPVCHAPHGHTCRPDAEHQPPAGRADFAVDDARRLFCRISAVGAPRLQWMKPRADNVVRDRQQRYIELGKGCSIVKMLPSVSLHLTNVPTVGISILSPRTWPPADLTFAIAWSILSTPTTHE